MAKLIPLTPGVAQHAAATFGSAEAARSSMDRAHFAGPPPDREGLEHRIISLSDLHVGAGTDPITGRLDVTDDWRPVQERQFYRFLGKEWLRASDHGGKVDENRLLDRMGELPWPGTPVKPKEKLALCEEPQYKLTLNLNGDILELMQSTVPKTGYTFPDGFDGAGGPRTTPANTIVKINQIRDGHPEFFKAMALHLSLGHHIDFIPGNHDRDLWNDHVWKGSLELPDGRRLEGVQGILRAELAELGLGSKDQAEALSRLRRLPFAVYGDTWLDHGHHEDSFNRTRRPFKQINETSGLHEEMPQAFGDYGVRDGYDALERKMPSLSDKHHSPMAFAAAALQKPQSMLGMMRGFLKATAKHSHETSAEADAEQRVRDAASLVDQMPELVDMLNAHRPPDRQLTPEQVKKGLQSLEQVSATPLYSMLESGAGFFKRIGAVLKAKDASHESHRERRLKELFKHFGITHLMQGHTHQAADQSFINADGHRLRYQNTHTWTDQFGRWGPGHQTWGSNGRGVGVIEIGRDGEGRTWTDSRLKMVRDGSGDVMHGTLIEESVEADPKEQERAKVIFEKSKRGRNDNGPDWKKRPNPSKRRKVV